MQSATSLPDVRTRPTSSSPFELTPETPKPKPPPKQPKQQRQSANDRRDCGYWSNRTAPADPEELWFRHTHWENRRKLVHAALIGAGTGARQIDAFEQCGSECVVEFCQEANEYRLRANYCKCRHCAPCAQAKANLIAANLRHRLDETPDGRYRFITLTLKHRDVPLMDQLARLRSCFTKLRNGKLWKGTQRGGAAIVEVKWIKETGEWHPHLHVIAEGDFMDKRDLSKAWFSATGDSYIVDIRALDCGSDAAHYVAKYIGKGTNGEVWHDPAAAIEWVVATRGLRTAATFGTWRGFKLLGHDEDTQKWVPVGTLTTIIQAARDKEPWATGALRALIDKCQYNPAKPRARKNPIELAADS